MEEGSSPHPDSSVPAVSNRHENSLHLTTQRFMMLRQITKDKILNLNDAADFLVVPKRRLYDITNVLEGIGMVEKIGKNAIRWLDQIPDHVRQEQLKEHVETLINQEENIDDLIRDLRNMNKLSSIDPVHQSYAYVNKEDFQKTCGDRQSIAIKELTHSTTSLEIQVSDPFISGAYEMIARNNSGKPIVAYLCKTNHVCSSFEPSSSIAASADNKNNNNNNNDVKDEHNDDYESKPERLDDYSGEGVVLSTIDIKHESLDSENSLNGFIKMEAPNASDLRPWNTLSSPPNLFDIFPQDDDWMSHEKFV